ncbi:MAG: hypothetical protein N4A37_11160 [Prolixibacteraceae bacterium]|jgi:hypothetical protein|nr:hypothetical protein [Prolixibacteraceae bacterium]
MTNYNSIHTPYQGSEVKAYIVNDSVANRHLLMAYTTLAVSAIVLYLIHNFIAISVSFVYLYVAYWQKDRKAIILFDKYIEFKVAPGVSTKQIRYKDIKEIEDISEKKIIIHYTDGKKTRIPVALISHEDRRDLLNRLKVSNATHHTPSHILENKSYFVKESLIKEQIKVGSIMLAIGIIVYLITENFGIIAASSIYLFAAFWQKKRKPIRLLDRYIEIKVAPIAPSLQIRYTDITKIEDISDKKVIIHCHDRMKANIPVALICYEDKKDLLNRLHKATAA